MTKLYVPLQKNRNFDLKNSTFNLEELGRESVDYFAIDVEIVEPKFYWYTYTSTGRRFIKLSKKNELKIIEDAENAKPTKLSRREFDQLAHDNQLQTNWVNTETFEPFDAPF